MVKKAYLFKKLSGERVQCRSCAHYCVLAPGQKGKCHVKENQNGVLVSLNYRKCAAFNLDPIEKKPLFHFLPATLSLSFAAPGCNFGCLNCQNWDLSQGPKIFNKIETEELSPEMIVEIALKEKTPSISYTYTEPTVFLEYAFDTMKLAREKGLKNVWVTNGFLSKEARELIFPYLDAANVDLKSFEDGFYRKFCSGRLAPVLETLEEMKKNKIWLEVTTLIIPSLTDSPDNLKNIARFIKNKLGEDTPWHVSRFSGVISWRLQHLPPTPLETLLKAWQIGKEEGLKYVYVGNAPELEKENTICAECGEVLVKRKGFFVERHDKNGRCPKCKSKIPGVF